MAIPQLVLKETLPSRRGHIFQGSGARGLPGNKPPKQSPYPEAGYSQESWLCPEF